MLTLIELGEIWKCNLGLYSRNLFFHVFPELGKIQKSSWSNIQKSKNLFVNWEKLGSITWDQHKKSHIWIYEWLGKIYVLSFTIENKIANLHKIRLFAFISNLTYNELDMLYTSNLRMHQRIGENMFSTGKKLILNTLKILCRPQSFWH